MYLQQALHALQTGVVAPCHSNNPLILMNGEPIYESQNKPDCSRLTLQAGEDQEMEMGEEALDNAVCQEETDLLLSEGIGGTKRSRDDEDRSCFKRQRCFGRQPVVENNPAPATLQSFLLSRFHTLPFSDLCALLRSVFHR